MWIYQQDSPRSCRDRGVLRRERQKQLSIIGITVIGKPMRADDRAQRSGVNGKEKWSVKVSWSSIMTPRFLAVLDGTRDKESILMLMLWWMACLAGKTISSVLARFS